MKPGLLWLLLAVGASEAGVWPPYVMAWPDSAGDVLVAETRSNTLYRYSREADGEILVDERYMSIGQRGDGKRRDRDRKTPLGVYFVTGRIDTSDLHPQYGIAAFPLDYPNARDRQLGRTGDGIWIHGVLPGPGRRPPRDTDGCISLPNEELRRLVPLFRPQATPIILAREIEPLGPSERHQLREELGDAVSAWSADIANGRLAAFVDHYHPDFSYLGLNRADWSVLQYQEFTSRESNDVSISNLFIAAHPEERGLYVTRFDYGSDDAGPKKKRRLYWRRDSSGIFRIIAEDDI